MEQISFAVVGPTGGTPASPQMTTEDDTPRDRPGEQTQNRGHRLLRIDEDGRVMDPIPMEIREKFSDHLFSAVYDGGCIRLQGVR